MKMSSCECQNKGQVAIKNCNLKSVYLYVCYDKNINDLQNSSPEPQPESVPETPLVPQDRYIPNPGSKIAIPETPECDQPKTPSDQVLIEQMLAVPTLAVRYSWIYIY